MNHTVYIAASVSRPILPGNRAATTAQALQIQYLHLAALEPHQTLLFKQLETPAHHFAHRAQARRRSADG